MSKKTVEIKKYTEWELNTYADQLVVAAHNALAQDEKRLGKRCYETFGEWKQRHPNHPMAHKDYPKDEYIMVISTYRNHFERAAATLLDDDDELM